uniref:CUB domain-containing protein n=2 Tax=Ditylenchus dipsaci TaxID=166011 RepID=A0A915DRB9_9BILA
MLLLTKDYRNGIIIWRTNFVIGIWVFAVFNSVTSNKSKTALSLASPGAVRAARQSGAPGSVQCPVRIISTRVHQPSTSSESDPLNPEFGEFEGEALPNYGENIHPWPHNNSGMLSNEHVQLIFHRFRLYTEKGVWQNVSSLRCEQEDHITAHVLVGSRMSKIYDFCGRELPPQLMSTKNLLTLDYVVRSFGRGRMPVQPTAHEYDYETDYGFLLEYRFLLDYGEQPAEVIKSPNQTCGFMFNGTVKTSGKIWSPNYPGFYPRNLDCQYVFHGLETQIVLINFEYFDVEGFGQCEESTHSDYVLFSNYMTLDRTNRRYCDGMRPPRAAIASESNYFRMQFRTNDMFDGTGFYAHYQFLDEQISQKKRAKFTASSNKAVPTVANEWKTAATSAAIALFDPSSEYLSSSPIPLLSLVIAGGNS